MGRTNITGIDTSDATLTSARKDTLLDGLIAYGKDGEKVIGTMANHSFITFTPSNTRQTSGEGYYSGITVNPQPGLDINGIIKEYTAQGNISAGRFR